MEKVRVHIFVLGKVQGVFFRDSVMKRARKLGVFGWVQNLSDNRVEAIFEGEKEKVEKIVKWTKKGPMFARVDKVDLELQEYTGEFKDFQIKYPELDEIIKRIE